METLDETCKELYHGPDHVQMNLHKKFFEYVPNPYYCDVLIASERLESLPEERNSLPGLKVVQCDKIYEMIQNH